MSNNEINDLLKKLRWFLPLKVDGEETVMIFQSKEHAESMADRLRIDKSKIYQG